MLSAALMAGGLFIAGDAEAQVARVIENADTACFDIGTEAMVYQIMRREGDKNYAAYSQLVREKIKGTLKQEYTHYYNDGEVTLFFIIRSDGTLEKFGVDRKRSTGDTKLIKVAVSSLKDSSPFPPFPETLSDEELPFSLTVSFKE